MSREGRARPRTRSWTACLANSTATAGGDTSDMVLKVMLLGTNIFIVRDLNTKSKKLDKNSKMLFFN